jgi:hypothetical protein
MQKFHLGLRALFAARPGCRNCNQARVQIMHSGSLKEMIACRPVGKNCIQAIPIGAFV